MHALTVSEARANLYRLIDETAESHEPIIISGSAVAPSCSLPKIGVPFKKPCTCLPYQVCANP